MTARQDLVTQTHRMAAHFSSDLKSTLKFLNSSKKHLRAESADEMAQMVIRLCNYAPSKCMCVPLDVLS